MPTLLQIRLSPHSTTTVQNETHGVYDFIKDFAWPLIIAAVGAYMVWWVFVRQNAEDAKNERERLSAERQAEIDRKINERNDRLLYLSELVTSATSSTIRQKENLEKLINDIDANLVGYHFLSQVPLNDLKRISEDLELEHYLLAYLEFYKAHRKIAVTEFKEIISCFDYFSSVFVELPKQLEKSQKFDYERKQKYQSIFNDAGGLYRLILFQANRGYEYYQAVLEIDNNFKAHFNGDKYDVNFYHHYFFKPLEEFFDNYFTDIYKSVTQEVLDLSKFVSMGINHYNHMTSEATILKNDMTENLENINNALTELTTHSKALLRDF